MAYNLVSIKNPFDARIAANVRQMVPASVLSQKNSAANAGITPNNLSTEGTFDNGDGMTSQILYWNLDSWNTPGFVWG